FDEDGLYTKKYLPELKNIPKKYLFNPWEAPEDILKKANINLGVNYPKPIVGIKESREKALSAFSQIK
ncbi:MAG: deoxyribodipyrimidine photo-lyase, partial [Pelagibacterales bacterium]|nr:deoxyribodipyrimidine photo-lyase [Pelagibacterales bacterium]